MCTALQAVASPLGHSTVGPPRSRADDGIRTRDPHLGKVMRYQLRYIRTVLGRSSAPCLAFENISRRLTQRPNWLVSGSRRAMGRRTGGTEPAGGGLPEPGDRRRMNRPVGPGGGGPDTPSAPAGAWCGDGDFGSPASSCYCSCPSVFIDSFDVARSWSRGSVEERPVHTGEVAGSIPAGTTHDRSFRPSRRPSHHVRPSPLSVSLCSSANHRRLVIDLLVQNSYADRHGPAEIVR